MFCFSLTLTYRVRWKYHCILCCTWFSPTTNSVFVQTQVKTKPKVSNFIIIFIYLFKIFYFLFSFHCSLTSFFSKLERQKNWSRYIYVRLVLNIFIQYIIEGLARHRSRWTTGLEVHDWSSFQCRSWRMWLGA